MVHLQISLKTSFQYSLYVYTSPDWTYTIRYFRYRINKCWHKCPECLTYIPMTFCEKRNWSEIKNFFSCDKTGRRYYIRVNRDRCLLRSRVYLRNNPVWYKVARSNSVLAIFWGKKASFLYTLSDNVRIFLDFDSWRAFVQVAVKENRDWFNI